MRSWLLIVCGALWLLFVACPGPKLIDEKNPQSDAGSTDRVGAIDVSAGEPGSDVVADAKAPPEAPQDTSEPKVDQRGPDTIAPRPDKGPAEPQPEPPPERTPPTEPTSEDAGTTPDIGGQDSGPVVEAPPEKRQTRSPTDTSCVKAGEVILLPGGVRRSYRLKLTACPNTPPGRVVIKSDNGKLAQLYGARTLASMKIKWQHLKNSPFSWHKGTPIYWAQMPANAQVRQFFYRDQRGQWARTPNANDKVDPYMRIAKAWSSGTDHRLQFTKDRLLSLRIGGVQQANVYVRTSNWSTHRAGVTAVDPKAPILRLRSTLRFPVSGNNLPAAGNGVFLVGNLGFLDQRNEWAYNTQTRRLYYWAPDDKAPDPTKSEVVLVSAHQNIIAFDGQQKLALTIENVETQRAMYDCIRVVNVTDLQMTNVIARRCGNNGIGITATKIKGKLLPAKKAVLRNVSAQYIPGVGVRVSHVDTLQIIGNGKTSLMSHVGVYSNQYTTSFSGIQIDNARQVTIRGMLIKEVGYSGISLGDPAVKSGTVWISGNQISRFCTMLNDCGGIYINGFKGVVKDATKKLITNNVLATSIGEVRGYGPSNRVIASGIYLDWAASYFTVAGNRLSGTRSVTGGIYLHGGDHNIVRCNRAQATLGPAFVLRRLAQCRTRAISANRVFYNYLAGVGGVDTSFRTEDAKRSQTIAVGVLSNKNVGAKGKPAMPCDAKGKFLLPASQPSPAHQFTTAVTNTSRCKDLP